MTPPLPQTPLNPSLKWQALLAAADSAGGPAGAPYEAPQPATSACLPWLLAGRRAGSMWRLCHCLSSLRAGLQLAQACLHQSL